MKHRKGNWESSTAAVVNARRELPLFAADYFVAGRKAVCKGVSPEELHGFRLATKHFRYLLELFRPLYGPGIEPFFKHLREVQTLLGELNDYAATRALIEQEQKKPGREARRLFAYLTLQRKKKLAEFRRYWEQQFDVEGAEEQWNTYLARSPRVVGERGKGKT